jgi:multisubunit Na+/H+ antiporter MnhB subunit
MAAAKKKEGATQKEPESFLSVLGKIFSLVAILCGVFWGHLTLAKAFDPSMAGAPAANTVGLANKFNVATGTLNGFIGGGKVGEAAGLGLLNIGIADQIRRTEPKK